MVHPCKLAALVVVLICLAALVAFPTGCTTEQIEKARDALGLARETAAAFDDDVDDLVAQKAEADAEIATMPPGPDRDAAVAWSAKLDGYVATYRRQAAKADAAADDLAAKLATAEDEIDVLEAVGEVALPFAGQFAPLAGLALATILGVWRAVKNGRRADKIEATARRVVGAIDAAKDGNGVVFFASDKTKATLSAAMGSEGKALVDSGQGKAN